MLRNQWDLGIYLNMTLLKVEQGHFFRLLLRFQVFGNIILNIFMIQTLCTVMQLFKGSYFSVDAILRHFWPNLAIVNGTDARIYESCFTCFKIEYKRSHIFKALPGKTKKEKRIISEQHDTSFLHTKHLSLFGKDD